MIKTKFGNLDHIMTESTHQFIISSLIIKGNECISHIKQSFIFRSSLAYIGHHIHIFLTGLTPITQTQITDSQIQALRQLQELFNHFDSVVSHLSEKKWIQPALNWPASYVHIYIDGFRDNLTKVAPAFGLMSNDLFNYDKEQDMINKHADLKALKASLENLLDKIDISDAVGVQQQVQTKLSEINKIIPPTKVDHRSSKRRPSAERLPVITMKNRVEHLLSQFKNINIEVENILLREQIGAGGFGTVYKATRLSTSEVLAVKELRSDRLTMASWASLYAEVETMASVRHPYVLELVGAHITEPYRIITRFCPGKSLFERIHRSNSKFPSLSPTRLTLIAYQVAVGMAHLHSLRIVHRDLKTLNILLDEEDNGCVADFGLSGMMKDNQELCGGVGTPHYTAPEVLSHSRYGPKVDSFSFAVVLWEMLVRKVPYGEMTHMAIYEHVVTRNWRLPIPHDTPDGLKKLITHCWSKNPNDRPEFKEIVQLFEKGDIYFPGSEEINFQDLKIVHQCPLLDLEFAFSCLKDPHNPHFSSICYYICSKIDTNLRNELKKQNLFETLVKAEVNIDAILLLASAILEQDELSDFLGNGGLEMFKKCIDTENGQEVSAALKFGLKISLDDLNKLRGFLPQIVKYLDVTSSSMISHALQFITRFPNDELSKFTENISYALINTAEEVDDQQTFDAIVSLLPLCKETIIPTAMQRFYKLLNGKFIVPQTFVETLIQASTKSSHPNLILSILKATAKSDITEIFLQFLQKCEKEEKETFNSLYKIDSFFETMQNLIEIGSVRSPLFLIFCIAPIEDAALRIANHPVLSSLLQMKGFQNQCLHVLTVLCMHEKFCLKTTAIDGIIHLLVASLSKNNLVSSAVRLIGAFSSHACGCNILSDNGVLELFTQLFLTSSGNDTATSHTILRNIARQNCEIPQGSLIVSCLMQDMIYDINRRCEILDTLIALVEVMPGSVQEHDLQRVVMPQIKVSDKPLLIHLALSVFAVCEPTVLRNIYPQLLASIYELLDNPNNMYPEIIMPCLKIITQISTQVDISEFIKKIELFTFIDEIVKLLQEDSENDCKIIIGFKNDLISQNQY
ncbi:TKL family protein kinase [Tritrichomonas foetus]|uniref:TKL family protein kinase n=1 Tax=Tritrichomonas foetus TaxID=1144522 RepID=A0A1J4JEJ6_9EUKA|nr:TKL family protein kinase [Tritrichomonas foetus]|eukprot:OHS95861.1 TKL family protein kinase [Tritrichomonas foetus]